MRHRVRGYKLGRTAAHRTAMTKNMMVSLIDHERITTTVPKAKHLRPKIEKMVTAGEIVRNNPGEADDGQRLSWAEAKTLLLCVRGGPALSSPAPRL